MLQKVLLKDLGLQAPIHTKHTSIHNKSRQDARDATKCQSSEHATVTDPDKHQANADKSPGRYVISAQLGNILQ